MEDYIGVIDYLIITIVCIQIITLIIMLKNMKL